MFSQKFVQDFRGLRSLIEARSQSPAWQAPPPQGLFTTQHRTESIG